MLNEERVKKEITKFCQEELGMKFDDMEVEDRHHIFWVKIGDFCTRIERRHLYDYIHGNRNGIGKAGILTALLNSKRK